MKRLLAAVTLAWTAMAHGAPPAVGEIARLQRQADGGDARAAFHLGRNYRNGIGVETDSRRARALIEAAALKRHPPAMFIMANMLMSGEGGLADQTAARTWLEEAADLDHPEALQMLALCLREGTMGYVIDEMRSAHLMRKAAHAMKHRHG